MKLLPLSQGKFAEVCDCHYELVTQFKWYYHSTGYAWTKQLDGVKITRMHRLIMNEPEGLEVDHIDGNGLNNHCLNLRTATHRENLMNRGPNKNNTSGYKGVLWFKPRQKWRASIRIHDREIHLGYFDDKLDAAKAYNAAADTYFGKFAWRNPV